MSIRRSRKLFMNSRRDILGIGDSGNILEIDVISGVMFGVGVPSEDTLGVDPSSLGVLDSSSSTLPWLSPVFPGGSYRATTARKGLVWLKAFPKPTLFDPFHTTSK